MRDCDIRPTLREWLDSRYCSEPNSLIVEELGLCQGSVRADFAVVNGSFKGFEIKSEHDSLARLDRQAATYSQVFDSVSLVAAERHLKQARAIVPRWWGICVIRMAKGSTPSVEVLRKEKPNPNVDARSLVQLLWRDEVIEILARAVPGVVRTSKARRLLWAELIETLPLAELKEVVRTTLKTRRNWRVDQVQRQDGVMFQPFAKSSNSPARLSGDRTRRYTHRPS
jgi:hypothetical protein